MADQQRTPKPAQAAEQQVQEPAEGGEQRQDKVEKEEEEEEEASPKLYTSISFLKKRPDITHDQFYHHWSQVHGPLALPWMKRHGFRSYTQYHAQPSLNAAGRFSAIGPENAHSRDVDILRGYDGAAVVEVDSLEAFQRAFEDEYYKNVIAEDEKKFLDKGSGVLRMRAEAKKILKLL